MIKFPNLTQEKILAVDIETFDPDLKKLGPGPRRNGYILGVSIAAKDKEWYFSLNHPNTQNIKEDIFFNWFNDLAGKHFFVFSNALYDLDYLQYKGFNPRHEIFDTGIAEPLINENQFKFGLDAVSEKYLGVQKDEFEILNYCASNDWKGDPQNHLWKMPGEIVAGYAKKDARLTFDVFEEQFKLLKSEDLLNVFYMECGLIPFLLQMKKTGVRVNVDGIPKAYNFYDSKTKAALKELKSIAHTEVNVNAAASLKKVFDNLGLEYETTEKGNPSFTKTFLENHTHPITDVILEARHSMKMRDTFISGMDRFLVGDRIHASFNPMKSDEYGTVTGRFSSSLPNLQQIPARDPEAKKIIRGLFLPEEGSKWIKGDYSQIELRLLAHYAMGEGAEALRIGFNENPYMDIHSECAKMVFNTENVTKAQRSAAKTINFGVVYGMGQNKLCNSLGLTEKEGMDLLKQYNRKLPFLKNTSQKASSVAARRKYVKTIMGRKRRFPDPRFSYRALNSVIQGSAADVMKSAMLTAYNAGVFDTLPVHLTVHDEIDNSFDGSKAAKEALKELKHIAENTIKFKVPIIYDLEIGDNWGTLEDYTVKE